MTTLFLFLALTTVGFAAGIDDLFREYDKPDAPGAAVLVRRDGMVSLRKGYGLADVEAKESATERTNYRMASVSKAFTAVAALLLVDRGELSLDDTLAEIFPDFPAYGKNITVRHLLHHTSGLRDYEPLIPSQQSKQVSDADVLALMKRQSSGSFTPGSRYRYSNSGYCVLAQIVEKVSGLPYTRFVEETIFEPLGMTDSRVYDRDNPPVIPHRAYGYTRSGSGWARTDQSVTSATQGDGGIYTSPADYERWALGMETLLSAPLAAALFTPGKLNDGSVLTYGMGWVVDTYRGLERHSHTGSTIGFRTAVQRFPERGFTVAVFINRAGSAPWDICQRIADRFLFP